MYRYWCKDDKSPDSQRTASGVVAHADILTTASTTDVVRNAAAPSNGWVGKEMLLTSSDAATTTSGATEAQTDVLMNVWTTSFVARIVVMALAAGWRSHFFLIFSRGVGCCSSTMELGLVSVGNGPHEAQVVVVDHS